MGKISGLRTYLLEGPYSEAVRYLIFGFFNVIVTWGAYALFVYVGIEPFWSNVLSIMIGVLFGFVTNKFWVFGSRSTEKGTLGREFATFISGRAFTAVLATVLFPVLYGIGLDQDFLGTDGFLAKMVTTVVETVLNYALSKYLVFVRKQQ